MFGHEICSQCEKLTKLQKQLLQTSLSLQESNQKVHTGHDDHVVGEKIDQLDAT